MLGHARWLLWDGHFRWIQEPHPWWSNLIAYASAGLRYGHEAVICFFVLSGFFIHFRWARSAAHGRTTQFDLSDYAKRRAHRLVPPYMVALLSTLTLDTLGRFYFPWLYVAETGDDLLDRTFGRGGYSPSNVVPALLLLPGSLERDFGSNGPLWSLAYEFVYYALYPAWLWARVRIRMWAYPAACLAAVALSAVAPLPFIGSVFLMYPLWLAGAAMAEYMLRPPQRAPGMFWSIVLAGAGFVGFHFLKPPWVLVPYLLLGVGIVGAASAVNQAVADSRVHRTFEWLGLRSYTIYVCHFPFLALVSAAVFDAVGRRPSSGWLAAASVCMALAWCNAMWWVGERRYLHARFSLGSTS